MQLLCTPCEGAKLPAYATDGSAALDLFSLHPFTLRANEPMLVDTGVSMAIPEGYYGQIMGRSGYALKHQVSVHPGVIDCDYRGHVKVLMTKQSLGMSSVGNQLEFAQHDRIAQLLILPVARVAPVAVAELPATVRGAGGFGSTGTATFDNATVFPDLGQTPVQIEPEEPFYR